MGDSDLAVREDVNPETMLKIIFDYIAKITAERRLSHILMLMADMGREMILADRCTLWLLDEERQELRTTVAHDVSEIRIPIDSGIVGHTIRTGQAVIIDDAYQDDRFNWVVDQKTG